MSEAPRVSLRCSAILVTVTTRLPPKKVGRPKSEYSQAMRLLRMHDLLHHRQFVTIPQLMEQFGVDRRTIQRDLNVLQDAVAVEEDGRTPGNEKRFRAASTKKVEMFRITMGEMIALYMGRNVFAFTEGTDLKSSIDSLYDKLSVRLSSKRDNVRAALPKKFHCTVGSPRSYKSAEGVLDDIVEGIVADRRLAITYSRPGKKPYKDTLDPYTLVLHNHALFVVGRSEYADDVRMFAVERIATTELSDATFVMPADYDPSKFFSGAFGIIVGEEPSEVVVRFEAKVAPYVRARTWHPSMKLEDGKDGSVEVSLRVGITEELLHWICGYGKSATVVSPSALAARVSERRG